VEPAFADTEATIVAQGLRIGTRLLRRYHLALKSRKFVILSGLSGTGKTWLARAYAGAVGAAHLLVPVAPNWTTNETCWGTSIRWTVAATTTRRSAGFCAPRPRSIGTPPKMAWSRGRIIWCSTR
jgi:hypothetical protein